MDDGTWGGETQNLDLKFSGRVRWTLPSRENPDQRCYRLKGSISTGEKKAKSQNKKKGEIQTQKEIHVNRRKNAQEKKFAKTLEKKTDGECAGRSKGESKKKPIL